MVVKNFMTCKAARQRNCIITEKDCPQDRGLYGSKKPNITAL